MSTSETLGLLSHLREQGIELSIRGDALGARPSSALTPEIRAIVASRRAQLVAALADERAADPVPTTTSSPPAGRGLRAFPDRFEGMVMLTSARGPHDPPARGCPTCDGREYVRVRGGPMWFCPRCHPPQFEDAIVERMTAPEPSFWGLRRG